MKALPPETAKADQRIAFALSRGWKPDAAVEM